jgi:hypothetical protein
MGVNTTLAATLAAKKYSTDRIDAQAKAAYYSSPIT